MSEIRKELVGFLERTGMSLAEFSRRSGVNYDSLNKLKSRSTASTSAENAAKIRAAIKEALVETMDDYAPQRVDLHESAPPDADLVAVYDVQASAGYGALIDTEVQTHSLAFPPSYLNKLTSSSPANLSIISVKGDSMEPTLLDDDIVLLDQTKQHLGYDGLFVLRFNDTLHVKRVGLSPRKGFVRIISDNKDLYDASEMPLEEVDVVGKVLWYGRKV